MSNAPTEPMSLLVHGHGLPVQGAMLRLEFCADSLHIEELDGSRSEVAYDTLTIRPGGWSGESLMLEWEDPAGVRSVLLDDPQRFQQVLAVLPSGLLQRMGGWRRDARRSRRLLHVGLVLVIAATLVPLIAVSLLMLKADSVISRSTQRIPPSWEQQLGAQALQQMFLEDHIIHSGAAHTQFSAIADKLLQHLDAPYEGKILLVRGVRRSALVLPGGTIVVWSGLLEEMRAPQELAGLLAHEIEHGVLGHSLHAMLRARGMRAALGVLFLGAGTLDDAMAEIATNISTLAFSRSQEIAAEVAAVQLLAKSGWENNGLPNLLARLNRLSNEPLPIFAIHPQAWGHVETPPDGAARVEVAVSPKWQAVLDELRAETPTP